MSAGCPALASDRPAAKCVLLLSAVLGIACLVYGLIVLQAARCMWNTTTHVCVEVTQYLLAVYRTYFWRIFTFVVSLAYVNYRPALDLL